MINRFNRKIIPISLFAVFSMVGLLVGCSTESVPGPGFATGKPKLLRAIESSDLSLLVRLDNTDPDYVGQLRTEEDTWIVELNVELNRVHTFVASWYANSKNNQVLLMEQRGSFTAIATQMQSQPVTVDTSEGAAFDADCDGISNLVEMRDGSDPLDASSCTEPIDMDSGDMGSGDMGSGDISGVTPGDQTTSPTPSKTIPDVIALMGDCFEMGSPETDMFRNPDERQHEVCVEPFEIGRYEVTFDQYNAFAGSPGVAQSTPDDRTWGMGSRPVINVSWNDAIAYTRWLSDQTGDRYRLATEAEWEYAARAGTTTPFWTGDVLRNDEEHFGASDPYGGGVDTDRPDQNKTIPVGSLKANQFGLYDMLGNVIEFTCSLYSANYEDNLEKQCDYDITQPHVTRGAAFGYLASWARASTRNERFTPDRVSGNVGFRVVREIR